MEDELQLYDSGMAEYSEIMEKSHKEKPKGKPHSKRALIIRIPPDSTESDIRTLKSKFNELVKHSKSQGQSIQDNIFLLFMINFTWTILEIEISFFTPLLSVLVLNVIVIGLLLNHLKKHMKVPYDTLKFFKFLSKTVSGQLLILSGCELLILVAFFHHKFTETTSEKAPAEDKNWGRTSGLITIYFAPVKVFFYFLIAMQAVERSLLGSKFSMKHEDEREKFTSYHLQLKTFGRFSLYLSIITFVTGFWLIAEQKYSSQQTVHIVLSVAAFHAVVQICSGCYFMIKNYEIDGRRDVENI